jgi:hypothetical protein
MKPSLTQANAGKEDTYTKFKPGMILCPVNADFQLDGPRYALSPFVSFVPFCAPGRSPLN